jgi:hypothetical protein
MSDNGKVYCTVRIDDKRCNRCYECIQNWIKYDVHANGEVLIADNEIKTLNPNKDPFCEYLFLMSVNAEDLTDLLGK